MRNDAGELTPALARPAWIAAATAASLWSAHALYRIAARLLAALERRRSRRALASLDDRLLRDIGLTREQAARESSRSFWPL